MARLEEVRESLAKSLGAEEAERDRAYDLSRRITRLCRLRISEMVEREEGTDEAALLEEAKDLISLSSSPDGRSYGFVEDSLVEVSEAVILGRVLSGRDLPLPREVGIPERVFVLGACDAVGELRRIVLNRSIAGDLEGAIGAYERMKEVNSLFEGLSFPGGMLPLKKKQDVVRSLLDRTSGELAIAISLRRKNGKKGEG